uniref:Protein kinase domain-containing protein n=1 Tax=Acrobeloides nanus TaxID=290746 RepID=A0A914D7E4_9BILA
MTGETTEEKSNPADKEKGSDSDGSDNGAEEILEESPCKRWSKRREKVQQRDVPGIDAAYLAMDNETGNEVVWNEVLFSERKNFREQEEKLKSVFDNLTHLVHINLVKFHKYWTDTKSEKPRIIFITEYMSSGSMSRFLQRARSSKTALNIKAWKKWTTQILSALNYLHSCDPPIVHANLTCNTVFIQQNGLIKIGCVAPNAIHHHVKTFRENVRNMHYIAPEYEQQNEVTPQADIYSFGICALEMALPFGLQGCANGSGSETTAHVTTETIRKAIDSLTDPMQRDFIEKCLNRDPTKRSTARELLFHPILFEVHSLKLIAAHVIVDSKLIDYLSEDDFRVADPSHVAATSKFCQMTYRDLNSFQVDLDKFLDDVRNGIYPLIAFASLAHLPSRMNTSTSLASMVSQDNRALPAPKSATNLTTGAETSPSSSTASKTLGGTSTQQNVDHHGNETSRHILSVSSQSHAEKATAQDASGQQQQQAFASTASSTTTTEKPFHEIRLIVRMEASISGSSLRILLQLDDCMNRQLTTEISSSDNAESLVTELVHYGFISEKDSAKMSELLTITLGKHHSAASTPSTENDSPRKSSRTQPSEIVEKPNINNHSIGNNPTATTTES